MKYYLAYGSNLNVPQMKHRCPGAKAVGVAMIPDYELLFKGSKTGSYLTIEWKDGGEVPVAVYEITDQDEGALDYYEGYPTFYYKKEFDIRYKNFETNRKRKIRAFAYIMDERRALGVPSTHYIDVCAEGYKHYGFEEKYLLEAYRISVGKYGS